MNDTHHPSKVRLYTGVPMAVGVVGACLAVFDANGEVDGLNISEEGIFDIIVEDGCPIVPEGCPWTSDRIQIESVLKAYGRTFVRSRLALMGLAYGPFQNVVCVRRGDVLRAMSLYTDSEGNRKIREFTVTPDGLRDYAYPVDGVGEANGRLDSLIEGGDVIGRSAFKGIAEDALKGVWGRWTKNIIDILDGVEGRAGE